MAALSVLVAAASRPYACRSSAGSLSEDVGRTSLKLTLANLSPAPGKTPCYAARTERFYARNGLDPTITRFFAGGVTGTPALASGSAEKALTGATFVSGR